MSIGAIIQARTGSTRLPGKVMMELGDNTVLGHVIERVRQTQTIDRIIIATSELEADDDIVEEALLNGALVSRGSESDVLSRYYQAAVDFGLDHIVRITSDCPLIDPQVVDIIVSFYLEHDYPIVTNAGSVLSERTFPRGLDIEIFSFAALEEANQEARENYQREHVTPYIYENNNDVYHYKNDIDYSLHRWTLDTAEDWELIKEIYNNLYKGKHDFYLKDILALFDEKPELFLINKDIEQKALK